jgi:hypothetical protein
MSNEKMKKIELKLDIKSVIANVNVNDALQKVNTENNESYLLQSHMPKLCDCNQFFYSNNK